ncbi:MULTISPECIES: YrhB domain-containing protein [Streptomyces]|uniref:YrhB domain-containing protein n=1 Tax=Streptomyces TaxID=1883 RepID=UPI0016783D47|nr:MULTISPECIES: YrhB domain-containing protein [Streptomyces]MBD3580509.1 hypothetical protein [Streptomyces sp. KD18]GGT30492.1 hypothetical protein GCM10010286_64550 [Streptomyces toxytricini]
MHSKNQALEAARAHLAQAYANEPWTIVLLPEQSYEHRAAWVIRFDTQESLDSGDEFHGPLTKVVIVPKDGSAPHGPPSAVPLAVYLDMLERGTWPPTDTRSVASGPRLVAQNWLDATYRGLVELARAEPVAEDAGTWLFACRTIDQPGYPRTPMLAASLVVPKDGGEPFHPASDDPWGDTAAYTREPAPRDRQTQARRLNARGAVVSVASAIVGAPSSPLSWQPVHEAPGWWNLLLRRYFPGAEQLRCATWHEVIGRASETGPGTQGVVWVRRTIGGVEASGHLLYVHNHDGDVVFLDGMTGGLARLDTVTVQELVFARVQPAQASMAAGGAATFEDALRKAEEWLQRTYDEPVELVAPAPDDETARGWLFACETTAALHSGDWRRTMLDAGLVVPKDGREPFLLPNSDPWGYLAAWDRGEETEPTPLPGQAEWFGPTMARLGRVLDVSEFPTVTAATAALAALPPGGRSLLWVRRVDRRGRGSTGLLLTGFRTREGLLGIVDASAEEFRDLDGLQASGVRVIRYR